MKLLIKFPTRNRKDKFFNVLDLYYNLLDDIDNTEFCITIDEDDVSMNNDVVLNRLDKYKNLYYYIGDSKTKIEAINADMNDFKDFDILLLASDDMIPQKKGYDTIIRDNMSKHYPNKDGVLWFFDGNRKDLNTLVCMGYNYYKIFNYIYHPGYKSFFSDNEFMLVANKLGKQTYIDQCVIKHEHPDIPHYKDKLDDLYKKNSKYFQIDHDFFLLRKRNNFGLSFNKN